MKTLIFALLFFSLIDSLSNSLTIGSLTDIASLTTSVAESTTNSIIASTTQFMTTDAVTTAIPVINGPPNVTATIADCGCFIKFSFDAQIFQNGNSNNCGYLFSDPYLTFGANPICLWTDASTLLIYFGISPNYVIGDTITFLYNAIIGVNPVTTYLTNPVPISPPSNPPPITVIISGPKQISSCATTFTLDGTGSLGSASQDWTNITWSVTSSLDVTYLQAYLNSLSSQLTIQIPSSFLLSGAYTFSLRLANWLNVVGSSSFTVTKVNGNNPFFYFPSGNQVTALQSQDLFISAVVECLAENYIYSWSSSNYDLSSNPTKYCPDLFLPANSLTASSYSLTFSVMLNNTVIQR